jgi:hypothetical protein
MMVAASAALAGGLLATHVQARGGHGGGLAKVASEFRRCWTKAASKVLPEVTGRAFAEVALAMERAFTDVTLQF